VVVGFFFRQWLVLFSARAVNGFSSLDLYIMVSSQGISLQWVDIIWAFRWLLAKRGLLSLVGLCFIILRGLIVCSCNV
jgi:hypothetical protein